MATRKIQVKGEYFNIYNFFTPLNQERILVEMSTSCHEMEKLHRSIRHDLGKTRR